MAKKKKEKKQSKAADADSGYTESLDDAAKNNSCMPTFFKNKGGKSLLSNPFKAVKPEVRELPLTIIVNVPKSAEDIKRTAESKKHAEDPRYANKKPNELRIQLYQARDLLVMDKNLFSKGGSSDPYATLKLAGGDEFAPKIKSAIKKKCLDPVWNENHALYVSCPESEDEACPALEVSIYDHDMVSADDFMGSVTIPLNDVDGRGGTLEDKLWNRSWHQIKNDKGAAGEVELGLWWMYSEKRAIDLAAGFVDDTGPNIHEDTSDMGSIEDGKPKVMHHKGSDNPYDDDLEEVDGNIPIRVVVLHPCTALVVKKKILGKEGIAIEDQILVWRGKALRDTDEIPDECYGSVNEDGYMSHMFVVTRELDAAEEKKAEDNLDDDAEDGEEKLNTADAEARAEQYAYAAHLRKLAAKENAKFDKLLREATQFKLDTELEKIGCLGYLGKLVERGFNEKGAFSQITDDELAGPGMWVPKRARRRIMALAEMYRMQDQIAENEKAQEVQKFHEAHASESYTLDGETYFNTMQQMNREWDEAESFHNTLKQKNINARNRIARGAEGALNITAVHEPEGGIESIKTEEHHETLEDLHGGPAEGRMARHIKMLQEHQDDDDPAERLAKYLSLRAKGRLRQLELRVVERTKKEHCLPAHRIMSRINEQAQLDDWGLPVRFYHAPSHFCCEKHAELVRHRFHEYTNSLSAEVMAWLREELDEADTFKDGHIPQDSLRRLAEEILYEYGVEPTADVLQRIIEEAAVGDEHLFFNLSEFMHLIDRLIISAEAKRLDYLNTSTGEALVV